MADNGINDRYHGLPWALLALFRCRGSLGRRKVPGSEGIYPNTDGVGVFNLEGLLLALSQATLIDVMLGGMLSAFCSLTGLRLIKGCSGNKVHKTRTQT